MGRSGAVWDCFPFMLPEAHFGFSLSLLAWDICSIPGSILGQIELIKLVTLLELEGTEEQPSPVFYSTQHARKAWRGDGLTQSHQPA